MEYLVQRENMRKHSEDPRDGIEVGNEAYFIQVVEQVRKTKLFFIGMLNYVNLYYVFSDQTLRGEDFSLVKDILAD